MLHLNRYLKICLCFVFLIILSCASSPKSYKLKSISNVSEADNSSKQVISVVVLSNTESNKVLVYNWETYTLFNIYKKAISDSGYVKYGILKAGVKPDISALLTIFDDTRNSSIDDRYNVKPVVNGKELNSLPMDYVTNDSSYYKQLEE